MSAPSRSVVAAPFGLLLLLLLGACDEPVSVTDGGGPGERDGGTTHDAGPPVTDRAGFQHYRDEVEPRLVEACGSCHLGERFAFASLRRAGDTFTEAESIANYETFFDLLSLDDPPRSRLLAKILPDTDPLSMLHRGGPQVTGTDDPLYVALLAWARLEKTESCPACGVTAPSAYVAYVQHPAIHWMIQADPIRTDRGERRDTRIMLQPVSPATAEPTGSPIDFLEGNTNGFCADGDCDFGRLAASHDGTRLAFECRSSVHGEPWIDRAWNLCIAEIGEDGRAVDPRFLVPEEDRHYSSTAARTTPFGLPNGDTISPYNKHYQIRVRRDATPVFSPDDQRLIFSSERPDPRSGADMVQTYHGTYFLGHIISTALDGSDPRTLYRNEGGTADLPFFLRNGNLAFHTWNLDRMDRHLYTQATQTGMMEIPILGGHVQGPNMWGTAFQTNNGVVIGLTGRRRGELDNYAPFAFDHTMGIATIDPAGDTTERGFRMLVDGMLEEIGDYPNGYCDGASTPEEARATSNCSLTRLTLDPSYLPDGRALIAYNPETTYIGMGEGFYLSFGSGDTVEARQASVAPFLPQRLGVGTLDLHGELTTLIENPPGTYLRHPVWVGRRQPPRIQTPPAEAATADWAELHIADLPIWLSFVVGTNGASKATAFGRTYSRIVALRVLRKISIDNACIADNRYIEMSNANTNGYHPSALGYIDATGYAQLVAPADAGGDAFGDIPLESDHSVRVRVPAGELLLLQGIDENGNVVAQHERVFALPPGEVVNSSVRRSQYHAQCASCHGVIEAGQDIDAARDPTRVAATLDYLTEASQAVDLVGAPERELTYLSELRPVLDRACVSCHAGESPAGELSLSDTYSTTGNYPAGGWATSPATDGEYLAFMADRDRVPSYNYSVSYAWLFRADHAEYQSHYASQMAADQPLGELAPWDPGYQNLFRAGPRGFTYLNAGENTTAFGRARSTPSNASRSFLIEVLTGRDLDGGQDYTGSQDHTSMLTEAEVRRWMAVLDVGMPYMARCNERTIPSGPHAGEPWGEPTTEVR